MSKIILYNNELPESVKGLFSALDAEMLPVPSCDMLSPPVRSHPDMLFSVLGEKLLLTDYNYINANRVFFEELKKKGIKVFSSEKRLSGKYPGDILFDAIKTEDLLIGNLGFTAPELKKDVKNVNVRQGYALCSTLLMKNAAISADGGICKALFENGYTTLKISEGDILLKGYGCGFIGGASALLEYCKTVMFFGNIERHPCGEKIMSFCREQGYTVCYDKETVLTDYGGVKVI